MRCRSYLGCDVARFLGCDIARLLGCDVAKALGCDFAFVMGDVATVVGCDVAEGIEAVSFRKWCAVAEWCAWNYDGLGWDGRKFTAAELRACGHHPLFFGGGIRG